MSVGYPMLGPAPNLRNRGAKLFRYNLMQTRILNDPLSKIFAEDILTMGSGVLPPEVLNKYQLTMFVTKLLM